jgi:phytoene synthase
MRFEAGRARAYYDEARPLIGMVERGSRASLWALIEIYSRLLQRIEDRQYRVLEDRIRLSTWEKIWLVLEAGTKKLAGAF